VSGWFGQVTALSLALCEAEPVSPLNFVSREMDLDRMSDLRAGGLSDSKPMPMWKRAGGVGAF
jgi:hypothetical protein